MCLAIPGRLTSIHDDDPTKGIVDLEGVTREVSLALLTDGATEAESDAQVRVGDWVLVHVGFALNVVDESEAQETLAILRTMGGALEEELEQMKVSTS